jgi:hypothetical protein
VKGVKGIKGSPCLPDNSQIALEIMAYLGEHPEAQDTLEGIVEWWLLERKIIHQIDKVQEVLADLVKKQLIIETKSGASGVLYRLNLEGPQQNLPGQGRGRAKADRKKSR